MQGYFYTGFPLWQTVDDCVCNGLMSKEPGKLICTKLSFQINHASVLGTTMAALVLDAMSVNADAYQSALSNDIVAEYQELWFGSDFISWTIQFVTN